MAEFDKRYWDDHWSATDGNRHLPVNPYLPIETEHLLVGSALDAGCGEGAEALWLAQRGWRVSAADISEVALAAAQTHAADTGLGALIEWVAVDLARWEPERTWDLVVTNYAHANIGQLELYRRLSSWVAPGGTLLVVGHRHADDPARAHLHDDHVGLDHPDTAMTTVSEITALLPHSEWRIDAGYENARTVHLADHPVQLRDVIVRASRLA